MTVEFKEDHVGTYTFVQMTVIFIVTIVLVFIIFYTGKSKRDSIINAVGLVMSAAGFWIMTQHMTVMQVVAMFLFVFGAMLTVFSWEWK